MQLIKHISNTNSDIHVAVKETQFWSSSPPPPITVGPLLPLRCSNTLSVKDVVLRSEGATPSMFLGFIPQHCKTKTGFLLGLWRSVWA